MENKVMPEAINEIAQMIAACHFEGVGKLTKEEIETIPQFVCENFASDSNFELMKSIFSYLMGYYDYEFKSFYDLFEKVQLIMSYHIDTEGTQCGEL